MKMKLCCNWRTANATKFKPDTVRRDAVVFRKKKLSCVVDKKNENSAEQLQNWFADNQVSEYKMFQLYNVTPLTHEVYYQGLVFEFTHENDYVMFKLSCM